MKVELQGLTKVYHRKRALDAVSLEVDAGRVVAVLGANGSGKTTLLRCLCGMIVGNRGEIFYDGKAFRRDDIELRRRLFFMADFPYALMEMSAVQHIGMCLRIYGRERPGVEELALELLKEFDLLALAESPLGFLSRGQLYKAGLCALIAVDPELWLLDEPFASGMDPHGLAVFKQRAREAASRGRTIIYTTQIIEVVQRFSDAVCVLDNGELKAFAPFAELQANHASDPALARIFGALNEGAE